MAYLFGAGTTDSIRCGGGNAVTRHGDWSLFVRFKFTQSLNLADRRLVYFSTADYILCNAFIQTATGFLNRPYGGCSENNGHYVTAAGPGDLATPTGIHTLVATYNNPTVNLYLDTDSTPIASSSTGTQLADTGATQFFVIGNLPNAASQSADATIYEVGWWGSVLTGAEAAAMGSGTPPTADPSHYWPLISDAVSRFGGVDGTVVGAQVVAHSGTNLYGGKASTDALAVGLAEGADAASSQAPALFKSLNYKGA